MIIVGIDPGLDGALVALDPSGAVRRTLVMPTIEVVKEKGGKKGRHREYNVPELLSWLSYERDMGPTHVFVEKQQSMPKQGVASVFQTGMGYGLLLGLLSGMLVPYTIITAQSWQKGMLAGMAKKDGGKASEGNAAVVCARLWPTTRWLATDRSRVPHDGLCDAALIAEHGRRQLLTPYSGRYEAAGGAL